MRVRLAATLLVLAAAGCGAGDEARLNGALASRLAEQADAVAAAAERGDDCAAKARAEDLQRQTVAAINAGGVPPELQEELQSAVNGLAVRLECAPKLSPAEPEGAPPAALPEDDDEDADRGKGKGRGKGKKGEDD
jgi:hypothetical protein